MSERLPLRRRLRRRFWFRIARGALAGVEGLPPTWGRGICRGLGTAALVLRRSDALRARENLARTFPDQSDSWREGILRDSAAALGETLHASLTAPREAACGFPDVSEAVDPDGRGTLDVMKALLARGRGVLLVTGHIGCWELFGAWLAHHLDRMAVVTGTVHNARVDGLLQERRRAVGLEILPRSAGARPLLRALESGAVVGVLLDQNTHAASVEIPFLGRPAPTPLGPLKIARRRGVPLLPAAMPREDGGWVVRHLAPIEPDEDEVVLARRCNRALEELIRRNPAQWVWFHDRWNDAHER